MNRLLASLLGMFGIDPASTYVRETYEGDDLLSLFRKAGFTANVGGTVRISV